MTGTPSRPAGRAGPSGRHVPVGVTIPWAVALLFYICTPALAGTNLLQSRKLDVDHEGSEYRVRIRAASPGTDWGEEGRECGVLRLLLNRSYDQHVFLLGGPEPRDYEVLVGPLPRGSHLLELYWDRSWTPDLQQTPTIISLSTEAIPQGEPESEPLLRAPILHLRKDTLGRFSDVPLILYWEKEDLGAAAVKVTYTVVFSNEDGGTSTERLFARWGRTTDIEWCYAYAHDRHALLEEYQGADHKTLPFRGERQGLHPLLHTVTVNNNFSDAVDDRSEARVRPLPTFASLGKRSRESVMDAFPWTYRLMARELDREGKLEDPPDPDTVNASDPRNYAFVEVCAEQRGTELYFEVLVRGRSRWLRSDHADPRSSIGRSGCLRSALELPAGATSRDIQALRIRCRPAEVGNGAQPVSAPRARLDRIDRLFLLRSDYTPGENILRKSRSATLRPGQSLLIPISP